MRGKHREAPNRKTNTKSIKMLQRDISSQTSHKNCSLGNCTHGQHCKTYSTRNHLAGGESLGDNTLECELLLLEIISGGILDLKLGHGVAEGRFNLLLLATLESDRGSGV